MKAVLLALCIALLSIATSHAQMAIYRLSFSTIGTHVNYKAYQDGYYVVPVGGGAGSMILLQNAKGQKQFYSFASFGQGFIASEGGSQKMVISAVSTNTAATTTIFAIGPVNDTLQSEQTLATPATSSTSGTGATTTTTNSTTTPTATGTASTTPQTIIAQSQVARTLTGYEITADSQNDMPFIGASPNQGVAGVSSLTASLQQDVTTYAIAQAFTLQGAMTYLENILLQQGYTSGGTTTTSGTGATTTTTGN